MVRSNTIKKVNLSNLRVIASAGETLSTKIGRIISIYGMTELGGSISVHNEEKCGLNNYVGKVKMETQMIVIDDQGNHWVPIN